jgi:hypothetical protein
MTLTIHRSKRLIFTAVADPRHRSGVTARRVVEWEEWSFEPNDQKGWPGREFTFFHGRTASIPLAVVAPHFAAMVDRPGGKRLAFYGDEYGVDAASVATLAFGRQKGFRVQEEVTT